jgi:hypothetical protein
MKHHFLRRSVLLLVFCLFTASTAYADQGSQVPRLTFWDLVCDTWGAFSEVWQEAGSSLDPFGRDVSTSQSDAGSHLDPFGHPQGD